jgi:hypothetical protein
MFAPATTGRIWIIAPSITCSMKPTVIRCVSASADGVQREARSSGPLQSRSVPARMANSGAVRKKRNGAADRRRLFEGQQGLHYCG